MFKVWKLSINAEGADHHQKKIPLFLQRYSFLKKINLF